MIHLLLALVAAPVASAQEYREFDLVDGRTITAEVLDTDETGFVLRLPQGTLHLPFSNMRDMRVTTADAFDAVPPWPVAIVASADHRQGFVATFEAIPAIAIVGEAPGPDAEAVAACGADAACVRGAVPPGTWVVDARMEGTEARFTSSLVGTDVVIDAAADRTRPDDVTRAAYAALGLRPPPSPPPSDAVADIGQPDADLGHRDGDHPTTAPPAPRRSWTRERALRAAFVPIPGYPNFARGDRTGGALAVAAVLPATALWVGATGKSAQSAPEHLLLAAGGYYVSTVVVNQLLGARTLPDAVAVGVVPTGDAGAVVQVTLAP